MTPETLRLAMPMAGDRAAVYASPLTAAMNEFGISTPQRQAAFLAQIAHESGSLRWVLELGDGSSYEGRRDLGNTMPGDGSRYRGRGLLQITGRANYLACGAALGLSLIQSPQLLEVPLHACRSAGWFWSSKGLNKHADLDHFAALTRAINGGYNGIDDRIVKWITARKALNI